MKLVSVPNLLDVFLTRKIRVQQTKKVKSDNLVLTHLNLWCRVGATANEKERKDKAFHDFTPSIRKYS
jgi:hypothetical protein